ncbi:hypothetical protein [uncultured Jannaschia sp.]|uniref:hypothetical protein n=1 Tax=uncultured Jannaschia sp. TaxID=293347 RepID=UPI0026239CA8|nr:hypothetical protein [uncultured Jannaschia sp.]
MRPLPQPIGTVLQTLGRLGAAIPRAWVTDRVFRYATIAAGVALATLMARPWVDRSNTASTSLPVSGVETPGPDAPAAPLPPPGARYGDPAPASNEAGAAPAETPTGPLAPGRALDGLRIEIDPDAPADPFGTLRATDPASRPKETP